jgi:membrane protease YdiL (CAAX protease family)
MSPTIDPAFGGPGTALSLVLVAYLLAGEPVLGRLAYRRMAATRPTNPRALTGFLLLTLAVQWAMAAVVVVVVLGSPGVDRADVGVAPPRGGAGLATLGFTAAFAVGLLASTLTLRRLAAGGRPVPGQAGFAAMLPGNRAERALALAVAASAGICEELVYRGLLIAVGVGLLGLPAVAAAALSCLVFGLAHLYQGVGGVIGSTLVGAVLAAVYLVGASLLAPVLLHALLDARALLLVPPPARARA